MKDIIKLTLRVYKRGEISEEEAVETIIRTVKRRSNFFHEYSFAVGIYVAIIIYLIGLLLEIF